MAARHRTHVPASRQRARRISEIYVGTHRINQRSSRLHNDVVESNKNQREVSSIRTSKLRRGNSNRYNVAVDTRSKLIVS